MLPCSSNIEGVPKKSHLPKQIPRSHELWIYVSLWSLFFSIQIGFCWWNHGHIKRHQTFWQSSTPFDDSSPFLGDLLLFFTHHKIDYAPEFKHRYFKLWLFWGIHGVKFIPKFLETFFGLRKTPPSLEVLEILAMEKLRKTAPALTKLQQRAAEKSYPSLVSNKKFGVPGWLGCF